MADRISNPFVNAISAFSADPKGAAEGQYLTANTSVKTREAQILADRIAARQRLLANGGFAPGVIDAGLANDVVDPQKLQTAQGFNQGRGFLTTKDGAVNTNIDPKSLSIASLLMGNTLNETTGEMAAGRWPAAKPTSEPKLQFVPGSSGEPDRLFDPATGKVTFANNNGQVARGPAAAAPVATPTAAPVAAQPAAQPGAAGNVQPGMTFDRLIPSTVPGTPSVIVTMQMGANGEQKVVAQRAVDVSGGQGLSNAALSALQKERFAADQQLHAKAIASGDPFAWMLGRQLGLIDESGNRTRPTTPLNSYELNSFKTKAAAYHRAGYNMQEAFEAALESHPALKMGGGNLETKEWGNTFIPVDAEKDAGGNLLPDLGGGDFLTTKGFRQNLKKTEERSGKPDNPDTPDVDESFVYEVDLSNTDYSSNKGTLPVPFAVSAMGGNKSSVSNLFATKTATPQTATEFKPGSVLSDSQVGKWVYTKGPDGNPTFGIVIKPKGKPASVQYVTGELPD